MSQFKYDIRSGVKKIKTKTSLTISAITLGLTGLGMAVAIPVISHADSNSTNFESYTVGNINGQSGWSALGSAGSGCAVYDEGVSDNSLNSMAPSSFGTKSFRISNAVTSGCFGDQAFAPKLSEWAGEVGALDDTNTAVATPKPHFESQFDIASSTGAYQPGLINSVSPDNGQGARMSYLRFESQPDGIHVFFDDVTDPTHAINSETFNESSVATLTYSVPHTVKFSMDFVTGADNDVVKIYIDGTLVKTGTSWEDYYRFDTESQGSPHDANLENKTRAVNTLEFRASSVPAAPSTAGQGWLIDNLSLLSGAIPPTFVVATNKDQCKDMGWKTVTDSTGKSFKNQGDCVSYVATNGKNKANG